MASTDAVQEHDTDLESGPSEFPRSAGEETSTEIAPPAEESQVPDGIDSIDDETSATTKASHKAKKRKGISQKIKNAFKGKRSGKYVPTKEHHEQTSQDSGGKAESEITTDTATSGEEARNSLDSSDGKPEKSTLKRAHEEMTVKFRQHTRIVNVPVEQNSDWLNSIKVAVVAKFHDLLFPDAKEAELIFEKMKNNLLFQVYNADHGEFIDLTNDTILTEKAKLRLVMIPMTYGEADGTASSVKELVTDENILDQKKVIVVFGKHTRRVNIPARQGNEWMNSLKLAVVENFLDLLSPNGKQAEATFEKVKDGILLQVYDQTYDAFVDMTNDEVLPENANLKLEVINNCHEGTGGKALLKEYTAGMDRVSIKDKDVSVKFRQITRLVKLPAKQNPGWLNSFKLNVREVFQDMLDDEDSIDLEVYNSLVDEYIKLEEHHNLGFWDIVLVEVSSRPKSKEACRSRQTDEPGSYVSLKRIRDIMRHSDTDNDGRLNYHEFQHFKKSLTAQEEQSFPIEHGSYLIKAKPEVSDSLYLTISGSNVVATSTAASSATAWTISSSETTNDGTSYSIFTSSLNMAIDKQTKVVQAVTTVSTSYTSKFDFTTAFGRRYISPHTTQLNPTEFFTVMSDNSIKCLVDDSAFQITSLP